MSYLIKEKLIESTAKCTGTVASTAVGAALGTVVAGPFGAMIGALTGTAIEKAFIWAGDEIKTRLLSSAENRKIGCVCATAIQKIEKNIEMGMALRNDGFFEESVDNRSSCEEVLEGTMFAAQRESEEKKIQYLANLYANINFDTTVSRPMANQLIRIASSISFRQLEILAVIGRNNHGKIEEKFRDTEFRGFREYDDISIATEIYELYRKSLIFSNDAILDAASFTPSLLVVSGMGELLFKHMELFDMPISESINEIIAFLTDDSPIPPQDGIIAAQIPTITDEELDEILEIKTADIPRYEIRTEENDAGGQTLIINDRRLFDEKDVDKVL